VACAQIKALFERVETEKGVCLCMTAYQHLSI